MKKMIVLFVVLILVIPVMALPAFAVKKADVGVVDAGNKMCPVSGDPVSGKDFVTHKGVRYGLCCPMCKKPFLNDPVKYVAQIEVKEKVSASTATVVPVVPASKEMERDMEQGDL